MNSLTNFTRTQALSLLLAIVVVLPATAGVAASATTTDLTVSIDDDDNTIAPGETTTVAVAVTNVDSGVGAAELGVSLDDDSVATITDISVLNDPGLTDNTISDDGAFADFNYGLADSADTGEVTIIEVTVEAVAEGSTSIDIVQNSETENLVVFDEGGAGYTLDSVGSATLTVEDANAPPTASFTASPSAPEAGETVSFDASGSSDDGSIASYEWDFDGDGTTDASGEQVTNAFAAAGEYEVELTVTDDDGATDETTETVSVSDAPDPANQPPTADAGDDQTVAEGDSVALDASGSSDADSDDLSYDWTQTDGADVTLTDADTATPSFTAPDVDADETLTFEVTVSDGESTDTDTVAVTVEDADGEPPGDDDPPTETPSTGVSLSPESELVAVGDSAEYDIVVDDVDGGVGVYSMTVSVDDPSVASITDASLSNVSENTSDVEIAEDGSSATVEAVLVDTDDTGGVSLGTVTVDSAAEGTTGVSVDVSELGDESGNAYDVTATSNATLEASTLVVDDSDNPAQDPDGDGVYEDVNGDGTVDVLDVQALFADRNSDVVQDSPEAFDFNGDGEFSLLDIQTLFTEETG